MEINNDTIKIVNSSKKDNKNEILSYAKAFCNNGKYIFPVKRDKTPATPNGFKDATASFNEFLSMYKQGYGIGLLTGPKNNIYVVDLDVEKEDTGKKPILKDGHVIATGEQSFIQKFNNPKYLDTYTVQTQSGGKQLYFSLRDYQEPLKTHNDVFTKVDFKGDGGYVVAPPSLGPYGKYEVIIKKPVAPMPEELYDFWLDLDMPDDRKNEQYSIKLNDETTNILIESLYQIFKRPNGMRNHLIMGISGALALRNFSEEDIEKIIYNMALKIPDFDNDHPEWRSVIHNAIKRVQNDEKVIGFSTFLKDIEKIKDKIDDYDHVVENLKEILERKQNAYPFGYIDDEGIPHFNKGIAIEYVLNRFSSLVSDENENLYQFTEKKGWADNIEGVLLKFIQETDSSLSEHNINEILSGIKHLTYEANFKKQKLPNNMIPLPNGIYNVDTHRIEKHNKNYFYKNIERNYVPGIKEESLKLSGFLEKVLINPEKNKNNLYETLAWTLLNENKMQGMIIFYGEGGNGKGIIQNDVISNLLGSENIVMPDLTRIAKYDFELQSLIDKKAILFSESMKSVSYNWETLKRITGHDYENIPIKNKPSKLYQYNSAVILSTNSLIPPKDENAIWRRIINIIEFNNHLNSLEHEEISKIVDELKNPDELDRLFSYIIDEIYPKFVKHGFSKKYSIKIAKEKYLMKSNPAIAYLILKEARDEILTDPSDVLEFCNTHNYDQNMCYFIDKNGNETVFLLKETLIKQINKFCDVNHLPKYDVHDRNSQIKIGQAMHYIGMDITEFRKRIRGKNLHAWGGVFVMPDEDVPIIQDDQSFAKMDINEIDNLPDGAVKQAFIEERELLKLNEVETEKVNFKDDNQKSNIEDTLNQKAKDLFGPYNERYKFFKPPEEHIVIRELEIIERHLQLDEKLSNEEAKAIISKWEELGLAKIINNQIVAKYTRR